MCLYYLMQCNMVSIVSYYYTLWWANMDEKRKTTSSAQILFVFKHFWFMVGRRIYKSRTLHTNGQLYICKHTQIHTCRHAHVYIIFFFNLQKFVTVPHCTDYPTTITHTGICGPVCPAVLFIATGANPVSFPALGYPVVLVLIDIWQFSMSAMALMILGTGLVCRRLSHSLGFGTFLHQQVQFLHLW